MLEISSATNSLFKKYLSLLTSKGLKKEGLFLLSGKNLVNEFLQAPSFEIVSELYCEGQTPRTLPKSQIKLSKALFEELDILGTHSPILVLKQPELPKWTSEQAAPGLTVFTPLGDPSNLGALLRSAEAFQVQKIVLLQEAANPFLPKAVKASAGSVTRLKMEEGPSLQDLGSHRGAWIGLDMKGESLPKFEWPQSSYLIIGEEGAGLPDFPNLRKISVPTRHVESLNATVAASIALYDYSLKSKN